MFLGSVLPYVRRYLHLFPAPRTEVIIANNSGIFFTLASLKMHGPQCHPDLHLIIPDFWLDKTLNEYSSLHWGQTPRGLPWYVRQEFLEIYPAHKENDLIRWGQFKHLRSHVIQKLTSNGVNISYGTPTIIKNNSGYLVSSINSDPFTVPLNTYFYNTFREPDLGHDLANVTNVPSHTKLYTIPSENIPSSIILIGSGRSAIWTAQHFQTSVVSCIKRERSHLPLFKNEVKPNNLIEFPIEKFKPTGDQFEIKTVNAHNSAKEGSEPSVAVLDLHNNLNIVGKIFCAIGLKPNFDVTKCINKENLLSFPATRLSWFGSEETPLGSLMEATQRWAAATNNLSWAYETYCYHEDNFISLFSRKMEEAGIVLPYEFFDILREDTLAQQKTELTLNKIPLRSPSTEKVISLFKNAYSRTFGEETSDTALKSLEQELIKINQERLQQYHDLPNTRSFRNT